MPLTSVLAVERHLSLINRKRFHVAKEVHGVDEKMLPPNIS